MSNVNIEGAVNAIVRYNESVASRYPYIGIEGYNEPVGLKDSKSVDLRNGINYFDVINSFLKHVIVTSRKPTNTAVAIICTSKQWNTIGKNLFDRHPEVIDAFVVRIQWLATKVFDKPQIYLMQNTFFFIWMVDFLHNKKLVITNGESSEKLEKVIQLNDKSIQLSKKIKESKSDLLECAEYEVGPSVNNDAKAIIEQIFNNSSIIHEITFAELLYFINESFYSKEFKDTYHFNISLHYEILLHIVKNVQVDDCLILIAKIADRVEKHKVIMNVSSLAYGLIVDHGYKILTLIERLGNYIVKKESDSINQQLRTDYVALVLQTLHVFCWSKSNLKADYQKPDFFPRLAVKCLQLWSKELECPPNLIFNLIFDLRQWPKSYESVSDSIENFKQSNSCSLDNILQIAKEDVKTYFLLEKLKVAFTFEEIKKVMDYLCSENLKFLNRIKGYVKVITTLYRLSDQKSEVLKLIEHLYALSQKTIKTCEDMKLHESDYKIVMDNSLKYLKSVQ